MYEHYRATTKRDISLISDCKKKVQKSKNQILYRLEIKEIRGKTKFLKQKPGKNIDYYLYNLVEQLSSNESIHPLDKIQKLSFLSLRHIFLFGFIDSKKHNFKYFPYDFETYPIYRDLCNSFYNELHKYYNALFYYKLYLNEVGPLNEPAYSSVEPIEFKQEEFKKELLNCYRNYYGQLVGEGFLIESTFSNLFFEISNDVEDKVPENIARFNNLIDHSFTNFWFMPLAAVVLTRFAQFSILGRKRFNPNELLRPDLNFDLDPIKSQIYSNANRKQKSDVLFKVTLDLFRNIRSLLNDHLKESQITNIKESIKIILDDDYSYYFQSKHLFSPPIYDIDAMITLIGLSYQFEEERIKQLLDIFKSSLTNYSKLQTLLLANNYKEKNLAKELKAVQDLIHPQNYFACKPENELENKLIDNTKALVERHVLDNTTDEYGTPTKTDIFEALWNSLKPFMSITDFSGLSLYLTGAVIPSYSHRDEAPPFLVSRMLDFFRSI